MINEDPMTVFAGIVADLKNLDYAEYRESKLPGSIDDKITQACEVFKAASQAARAQLSAMLQDKYVRQVLLGYAIRMSMQSVRAKSRVLLINGLVAIGMMPERLDLNYDDYMALALLYHSAEKLRKPEQLFNEAVQYAIDESARAFILHFPARLAYDRRLAAFGYREVKGRHGLIYQYNKHPIPKGLL